MICFAALQPPQGMSQNMKFFYFTGACDSGNDAQNEIKRNFLVILNQFIRHQGGCAMNQLVCDANKVQVKCGKTQVVSGRKRSIQVRTSRKRDSHLAFVVIRIGTEGP